jgi:TonB family protein
MSAAVNDRPHQVLSGHLPLTGELHPLRREFERWLLTGNAIAITTAMVLFAAVYFWPRAEAIDIPDIVKEYDPKIFYPPPSDPGENTTRIQFNTPLVEEGIYEPVDDPNVEIDGPIGPSDGGLNWGGPLDPPVHSPAPDDFIWFTEGPVLLSIEPPVYPKMVRDAGIDGEVQVRVLIGVNGKVKDAYVVEGSRALREAALTSARTAVFTPALQGAHAVEVWVVIPIRFELSSHD